MILWLQPLHHCIPYQLCWNSVGLSSRQPVGSHRIRTFQNITRTTIMDSGIVQHMHIMLHKKLIHGTFNECHECLRVIILFANGIYNWALVCIPSIHYSTYTITIPEI